MSPIFYHPIIICFTLLNNIFEGDTYLYNSATFPDCYEGSERTTDIETGESGAERPTEPSIPYAYEGNFAPRHVNYAVNLRSHNNAYFK
jgi:hypothetical protein